MASLRFLTLRLGDGEIVTLDFFRWRLSDSFNDSPQSTFKVKMGGTIPPLPTYASVSCMEETLQ